MHLHALVVADELVVVALQVDPDLVAARVAVPVGLKRHVFELHDVLWQVGFEVVVHHALWAVLTVGEVPYTTNVDVVCEKVDGELITGVRQEHTCGGETTWASTNDS